MILNYLVKEKKVVAICNLLVDRRLKAETIYSKQLQVKAGTINNLNSKKAVIEDLSVSSGTINELSVPNLSANNLVAKDGTINNLVTTKLSSKDAIVTNLKNNSLTSNSGSIKALNTDSLTSNSGTIRKLTATESSLTNATIGTATINNGTIGTLTSDSISVPTGEISAKDFCASPGSVTNPGYAFCTKATKNRSPIGTTHSGLYLDNSENLGFSVSGTNQATLTSERLELTQGVLEAKPNSVTHGRLVVAPNGSGPLQASLSGNIRGQYAVDLQRAISGSRPSCSSRLFCYCRRSKQ